MFGLSQPREIDKEQLVYNVSEVILNIWSNPRLLPFEKFESFVEFANMVKANSATPARFFTEKLRITTSIALILLAKSGIDEDSISDIVKRVKLEATSIEHPDVRGASAALSLRAEDYANIRFSASPSVAGKLLESKFSEAAFGYVPSDSDTDRRYTLYKALSSFERSSIMEISNAIRKSRA